ncbi:MAG: transposase [Prevotellaceae bacterium]|nr:transposase [Prevotellaceae bacterium]
MNTPPLHHPFHSRVPLRWKGFDYTTAANYFVTVVCHERQNLFGTVYGNTVLLNDAGKMIEQSIDDISNRYENMEILQQVVMPNHIHFILSKYETKRSLSEIMDAFKSITTVEYIRGVRKNDLTPFNGQLWQRNYYEHIIRNRRSMEFITAYIYNNPLRWAADHLNPLCHDADEIMQAIKDLETGTPPPGTR